MRSYEKWPGYTISRDPLRGAHRFCALREPQKKNTSMFISASCSLYGALGKVNSFGISRIQPLFAKCRGVHLGWGYRIAGGTSARLNTQVHTGLFRLRQAVKLLGRWRGALIRFAAH